MSGEVLSFVPGPSHVRPEVLAALARAPLPHRSPDFREIVARVHRGLSALLGTRAPVFPVLASGTTALEVAMRAVARKRVLSLVGGAFAERGVRIARALGLTVETLTVPPGLAVAPDAIARGLDAGDFDTVLVTHSETSTGALADLPALAAVVRTHPGTALVVDAVSSLGGVDIDFDALGPLAVLVGVTGKCLACPPGLSIMAVAPEAAERARASDSGGYALDLAKLLDHHAKDDVPHTPSTLLFYALDFQLARIAADGGIATRAARHEEMATLVRAWAEEHFAVLAAPGSRSPTVTAIENTRGLDIPRLLADVQSRGYRIANGYGDLKGATFRIGHMGDVTPDETRGLLSALDDRLEALGSRL